MREQRDVTVLIYCHDLPGIQFEERIAVRLGIQKGQEVVDDVPAEGDGVTFTATLRVGGRDNGEPNFLGPYAHGKPGDRFLYLCWGERMAERWDAFRRAKVPLTHLDWRRLDQAWNDEKPVTLSVTMTDKRGGPACGTLEAD